MSLQLSSRTPETGPFVLRSLFEDVPLSADGASSDVGINCVEFWGQNLYVGTSSSEILHFFQIPPDPSDSSQTPTYILASRLAPNFTEPHTSQRPGVQQILLLPSVNKACVLCNWTVTFYSLPELSPIFSSIAISGSNWIGGLDLNGTPDPNGREIVTVLLSLNKRIRVVRVGEELKVPKNIDFAGSTITIRRGSFACVADARSYALLDVDRQLKIPLFPVSSSDDSQSGTVGGKAEDISGGPAKGLQRSASSAHPPHTAAGDRGHGRSTSLGNLIATTSRRPVPDDGGRDLSGRETPDPTFREGSPAPDITPTRPIQREASPAKRTTSPNKSLPPPPGEATASSQAPTSSAPTAANLKPHIVSPSPEEFLLVTGTGVSDPGVGIFVNLEGDVTRSTLEFDHYPDAIVSDGRGAGIDLTPSNAEDEEDGYILAAMNRDVEDEKQYGLEIQRWDLDPGEAGTQKFWLQIPAVSQPLENNTLRAGVRTVTDSGDVIFDDVVEKLRVKRFHPSGPRSLNASSLSLKSSDSRTATSLERVSQERDLFESRETAADDPMPEGWEEARNEEELQFARRLGHTKSRIVVWSENRIWWALRNPFALRIDAQLEATVASRDSSVSVTETRAAIIHTINSVRGREAKTETEFISLAYVRQHGGLLLFISFITDSEEPTELEYRNAEEALIEGGLDPRLIISLVPQLRIEVVEGKSGIWVSGGVRDAAEKYISERGSSSQDNKAAEVPRHILQFFRHFLTAWRRKKGFGSIANENEVFRSVDAALLSVLLELDKSSPKGLPRTKSIRSELNELVDHGVDCFERAVTLLENHHRLYVLSRLYQSRKMSGEVLATWKRIIEGELDEGGELTDGEQRVREYLINKVRNPALVEEYGIWLAARNPKLGVQVFTEERSKAKFEPTQVVEILRRGAPAAVKDYLEHLVFGKNHPEYVNELIAYYLDIVIHELETSKNSRDILAQTYEAYRALRPPKPTYRQFITDNALEDEWWHSRLRLLQLLGGSHGSASEYDVSAILKRIEPFTQDLVPEVIILDGRQNRHQEALKLLVHGLGDYDTAINYCLLGGSSIYHPISGTIAKESLPTQEEQTKLFKYLLAEFLTIEDFSNRIEQTSNLLERFGGWFDVNYVIRLIPDTWSVELVSGFLVSALRRIVRERNETSVAKALSGAENLKISEELVDKIRDLGPSVEAQQS